MNRKKNIFLFFTATILVLVFAYFAFESKIVQPKGESVGEVFLEYSHGVSFPDPEYGIIKCNNDIASFEYTFQNGELSSNFGLLLFLDGMLQPYSTDECNDVRLMHTVELQPGETKAIEIFFKPVVTQSTRSSLYIAVMYDAENNVANAETNSAFVHHLSQSIPMWVEMDTEQPQQEIPAMDMSDCVINDVEVSYSPYENLPESDTLLLDSITPFKGNSNFHLQVYCPTDKDIDYRVYLFENHRLVMWGDQQYYDVPVSAGSYADMSFALVSPNATSFYYAVAVPVGVADRWNAPLVVKSTSIVIS